jgi:putative ABC transport system ATP-binding protein
MVDLPMPAAHGGGDAADGAVVEAHELSRVYGKGDTAVHALRRVTLAVERGMLTAVMGPSGSGKSTLMHLLAALAD